MASEIASVPNKTLISNIVPNEKGAYADYALGSHERL